MDDIDLLRGVLDKTGDVVAGVTPDQLDQPTPCPEYDVAQLRDHIVGWLQGFAAGAQGGTYDGDPLSYHCGDDPEAEFRTAAAGVVDGWSQHGLDRQVSLTAGGQMPGQMVFNMTLMEYLTHGWDLATATHQPVPYSEAEAADVLERARNTLPAEFQGDGMPFGAIVPVPDDAPAVDRLMGFMGRQP
jgi:uncharacterized protein (TIGR03086 family)